MNSGLLAQILKFVAVGGVGFLIDGGLLFAMVWDGADPLLARAISFPVAVAVTWHMNRTWTFGMPGRGAEIRKRYICYFIVQLIGALSNYSIYVASLGVTGASAVGALYALAIGAIAGLSVNFAGARFVVFKLVTSSATESKNVRHNR